MKINNLFFKRTLSVFCIIALLLISTVCVNAQAGYAYAFGGEFFLPTYDDIRQAADSAALMNYRSYYNGLLTYSYVNSQRLNSDITYFSCHGDSEGLYFYESGLTITRRNSSGSDEIGLSSWNLTNTKLMIFDACSTAEGTYNICTTAINRGADCVLGWTDIISTESYDWFTRFYSRLVNGSTINAAVTYADSFNDYSSDSNLKKHIVYGNGNQVIKKASTSSASFEIMDLAKDERIHYITEVSFQYGSQDYSAIVTAIKSEFPDFDSSRYDITISSTSTDNKSFVVDFNEIVNDCWTSSGYTMIFNDEKTNIIYDNTVDASSHQIQLASTVMFNTAILKEANDHAASMVKAGNAIKSQQGELCYNKEEGTYFYRVYTQFGPEGTNYKRTMIYDYPLSGKETVLSR